MRKLHCDVCDKEIDEEMRYSRGIAFVSENDALRIDIRVSRGRPDTSDVDLCIYCFREIFSKSKPIFEILKEKEKHVAKEMEENPNVT